MTLATNEDVEQALMRELEDDEIGWVQAMLDYAEALIQLRMPEAIARCQSDPAYRTVVVRLEAECASRVLRAPGGGLYKYETEGTYTYSVNNAVASGLLEITPDEWKILGGGASGYGGLDAQMDGYARNRHLPLREGVIYATPPGARPPLPSNLDLAGVTVLSDPDDDWEY